MHRASLPAKTLVRMSMDALLENRLRSGITLSIIALGITALVGILTALDGLSASLQSNLSNLGAHSLTIVNRQGARFGGGRREGQRYPPIALREAERFMKRYEGPGKVAYSVQVSSQARVSFQGNTSNPNVAVRGVDGAYWAASGLEISAGRSFSQTEQKMGAPVLVLGHELRERLFGALSAVGRWCTVDGRKYRVVGVLAPRGSSIGRSADRSVLLPVAVARRQYPGSDRRSYQISVQAPNLAILEATQQQAGATFRLVRGLQPGEAQNFSIQRSDSLTNTLAENLRYVRYVAIVVGIITLFGAAIGLMNIMLVSVTERTREIGIRKALGAPRQAIRQQFLTEAVLISQAGGLTGIGVGLAMGNGVSAALEGPFVAPWGWMIGAVALCFAVGVAAGFYPAARASRLDAIESLRYE